MGCTQDVIRMLSRLLESRGSGVRLTQCVPRIGRSTREYDVRACDAHAAVLCVDPIHLTSYATETATRARAEMNNENNSRVSWRENEKHNQVEGGRTRRRRRNGPGEPPSSRQRQQSRWPSRRTARAGSRSGTVGSGTSSKLIITIRTSR